MLDALAHRHISRGWDGGAVGKTNKRSHSRMADPVGCSTRTLKLVNLFLKLPTTIGHVLQHANWLINHYSAPTPFPVVVGGWKSASGCFFFLFFDTTPRD
uniref:(northern house mosquito) hypothetical protein n=1 Tax=Culex pipiens TaxID=7175 RepID=A0A8D8CYC3_CULPI